MSLTGGIFLQGARPFFYVGLDREHLGIPTQNGHADFAWREKDRPEQIGRTVWSIFPADTDYFRSSAMINYRVANLDRMLEQLRGSGVTVEKTEDYDYGRFAWITDPEGNRIELWQAPST